MPPPETVYALIGILIFVNADVRLSINNSVIPKNALNNKVLNTFPFKTENNIIII